jgi:1-acyl-sn-glycerol-3-phosphate acyltransferase
MIPSRRSESVMRFFDVYVRRYVGRRFDRVRLWGTPQALDVPAGLPLLFVMSHAAWWDVLIGYYLARHVIRRESYAPMDEAQLRRYRILTRLGIYSVDRSSMAGLRAFLRYTTTLLSGDRCVWVTPQGEIVSNWKRPVRFQAGVGHLVRSAPEIAVVPVAVHYEFLEEARPEIFIRFGPARRFQAGRESAAEITTRLERDLEETLDRTLNDVTERSLDGYAVLLEGATSTSLVYDTVRSIRAWLTGRQDPARHGDVVSDPRKVRLK